MSLYSISTDRMASRQSSPPTRPFDFIDPASSAFDLDPLIVRPSSAPPFAHQVSESAGQNLLREAERPHTAVPYISPYIMDRREILSRGSALQKAIAAREPTAHIITILQDLKVNVKPNEELLRSTGIGKIVNKVKGITTVDPSIQQLASEIISRWRHVVNEQKLAAGGASTPNGARSNGTSSPTPASKLTPKASSPGVDPSKRNWKTDKVSRDELTSDPARNNCIGLLYDGLVMGSTKQMSEVLAIAKGIEAAVLALPESQSDKSATTNEFYRTKMRSLFQNLKNKSNPTLRARILSGSITPEQFASMPPEEMKSQEQRDEDARLRKENMNDAMAPQEARNISSSIECPKCHQKTVSYTQAQTRSADEPMTNFCECHNCGNRWRFS